jgi:hypothetical protein
MMEVREIGDVGKAGRLGRCKIGRLKNLEMASRGHQG